MSHIRRIAHQNKTMLLKTASYYVIHLCVAPMVAYAVTNKIKKTKTINLQETTVQAVAFFFHEKAWARKQNAPVAQAAPAVA